eukprot:m51a1_g9715 hypothetical protein (399) ;mRNA; f:1419571-1421124
MPALQPAKRGLVHAAVVSVAIAFSAISLTRSLTAEQRPSLDAIALSYSAPLMMSPRARPNASRVSAATMPYERYDSAKESWRAEVRRLRGMPEPPEEVVGFEPRGIVITCSANLFPLCFTNVQLLLDVLKTRLPIELWRQRGELTGKQEAMLEDEAARHPTQLRMRYTEELTATFERLFGSFERYSTGSVFATRKPYHLKVVAIVGSAFREVMLLDSDCLPAYDPEFLWESPEFRETGAVFWPDAMGAGRSWPIWDVIGVEPRDIRAVEAGVLMIDKGRNWRALMACAYMNQKQSFFYSLLHGDKDTFLFSWIGTGSPFHLVEFPPLAVGKTPGHAFKGISYAHSDTSGRLSFVHLLQRKGASVFSSARRWNAVQFFNPEKSAFYLLCDYAPHLWLQD